MVCGCLRILLCLVSTRDGDIGGEACEGCMGGGGSPSSIEQNYETSPLNPSGSIVPDLRVGGDLYLCVCNELGIMHQSSLKLSQKVDTLREILTK